MRSCSNIEEYQNGDLNSTEASVFREHLKICDSCSLRVELWENIKQELVEIDSKQSKNLNSLDSAFAKKIVEGASEQKIKTSVNLIFGLSGVLAASLAIVLFFVFFPSAQDSEDSSLPKVVSNYKNELKLVLSDQSKTIAFSIGEEIRVPDAALIVGNLSKDKIAVSNGGLFKILETQKNNTRIKLSSGVIACSVEKRNADEQFVVEVGTHVVKVVGTRFSVSRLDNDQLIVAVTEGIVEVSDSKGRVHRVKASNKLVAKHHGLGKITPLENQDITDIDNLLRGEFFRLIPKKNKNDNLNEFKTSKNASSTNVPKTQDKFKPHSPSANLGVWRSWIVSGQVEKANVALKSHVKTHPKDAKAHMLIANCERKQKNWNGAIGAYKKVIENGSSSSANKARFMAGTIFQDKLHNKDAAQQFFRQYLSLSKKGVSLRAEAMFRLARILKSVGQTTESEALLLQIVENHEGTSIASKAKRLLVK